MDHRRYRLLTAFGQGACVGPAKACLAHDHMAGSYRDKLSSRFARVRVRIAPPTVGRERADQILVVDASGRRRVPSARRHCQEARRIEREGPRSPRSGGANSTTPPLENSAIDLLTRPPYLGYRQGHLDSPCSWPAQSKFLLYRQKDNSHTATSVISWLSKWLTSGVCCTDTGRELEGKLGHSLGPIGRGETGDHNRAADGSKRIGQMSTGYCHRTGPQEQGARMSPTAKPCCPTLTRGLRPTAGTATSRPQ